MFALLKCFLPLVLLTAPAWAGDIFEHITTPYVDAYAASSTFRPPDVPGAGDASYQIVVSLTTTDDLAWEFGIVMRVRLEDGSMMALRRSVERSSVVATNDRNGITLRPTVCRFDLGPNKPVKIESWYIVRYHPEESDQLIRFNAK